MIEIRSYGRVFRLERRIYRIDNVRLNPGGVPIRGLVYLAFTAGAALLASRLPLLAQALASVPWYLTDVVVPVLCTFALTGLQIEGRSLHECLPGLLRLWLGPRVVRLDGSRAGQTKWRPQDVTFLPDGSDASLRGLRVRGPGRVVVAIEHRFTSRGRSPFSRGSRLALARVGDGRRLPRGRTALLGARTTLSVLRG
jgi:hypothetical protein